MSFSLGGQKTNSKTSSTETTTPNVPEWLLGPAQDLTSRLTGLSKTDPATLVPGLDPLQTQAGAAAGNLGAGSGQVARDNAQHLNNLIAVQTQGAPQISAASLLDNLTSYISPYTDQVVTSTLNDFDANAGKTRAQQTLDMAGSQAFGGSGAALTRSATEDALARGRATTEAGLRDQAFTTGANLSSQDAARRQSASEANASLKMQNRQDIASNIGQLAALLSGQDANTRANVATQEAAGAVNRGVTTDQVRAPFDFQAWLEQMYGGLNPELFTGKTTTGQSKTSGTGITAKAGFTYGGSGGGG